jgi:hypothetical protein
MDYKKYSLENLENWLHDALSAGEASPQEIYDTIKNVVQEQYYYYKDGASKTNELLSLLNGNGIGHIKAYDEYVTDPRGNRVKVCDKDDPSPECKSSWNDFWEENYYPEEHSKYYYEYDRNDPHRVNPFADKVVKWQLPVEVDDAAGDEEPIYYVNFPDDLLEAVNLKEGDLIEWVDNGDGSYTLRKTNAV